MKGSSSKSESKKRKRDESQESISETPKKAKVHAQRKFAQGVAFTSSSITPIKDKVRPPTTPSTPGPMLTNKCPNTEDFLTFLCFRRTSILPPKLDFFKDAFTTEPDSSPQDDKNLISHNSKADSFQNIKKKKTTKFEKKKAQNQSSVQALKKKYQEQRLAKQKVTNVTKLAQKVKGKNMIRTRSSGFVEEVKPITKVIKGYKSGPTGLRSGLKRSPTLPSNTKKALKKEKLVRAGLRSGGAVEDIVENVKKPKPVGVVAKKVDKEKKKVKLDDKELSPKKPKSKKSEGFSDFSSDDNEPLAVKKPKTNIRPINKMVALSKKVVKKSLMKTRSKIIENESGNLSVRPTRKTKEAAALYMEMLTKKLVSPEKSGDDDVSSVDSFPELPNAKRNEQRETEIKAKALVNKKTEPKQQVSDKQKESKKITAKKVEVTQKESDKNLKVGESNKLKKEKDDENKTKNNAKESTTPEVKRPGRKPSKINKELVKVNKQEDVVISPRPSTRSRPQEALDEKVESEELKKSPKPFILKRPGRKPKALKEFMMSPKPKTEEDTKNVDPTQESEVTKKVEKDENKEKSVALKKTRRTMSVQYQEQENKNKKENERSEITKKEKETEKKEKEKVLEKKEKEEPRKGVGKKEVEKKENIKKEKEPDKKEIEKKEICKKELDKKDLNKKESDKLEKKEKAIEKKETPKKEQEPEKKETDLAKKKEVEKKEFIKKGKEEDKKETDKKETEKKEKVTDKKEKKEEKNEKEIQDKNKKTSKHDKKEVKQENIINKRPTRKCSAADKIWIDIDGFTSDEDDFLEMTRTPKSKSSTTKTKVDKTDDKKVTKTENDKTKQTVSEKKAEETETSKNKNKGKAKEDEVSTKSNEIKESGGKNKEVKKTETKLSNENVENEKTADSEEGKIKNEITEVKETKKKVVEEPPRKAKNLPIISASEKLKITSEDTNESEESVKKPKPLLNKKDTKGVKKDAKEGKDGRKGKRSLRGRGSSKKVVEEEEPEIGRRKRPVRQCSTGEKRWIETDSDSFSFYESSEEENSMPKFPTKIEVKTSPTQPDLKETKEISKIEQPTVENFSDSDEEPLKKKSLLIEDVVAKLSETKPEIPPVQTTLIDQKVNKIQREMPGLTPLKKTSVDSQRKINEMGSVPPVIQMTPQIQPMPLPSVNTFISSEPKILVHEINKFPGTSETPENRPLPPMTKWRGNFNFDQQVPVTTLPNRIDMIFHTLKRDKIPETNPPYQRTVTFGSVPYQPMALPIQQQIPCTYQIKTVTFPAPREPISTHGLDLLSEVALPDTPKEKISSRTERIEKWLNDSVEAEQKKRLTTFEEAGDRHSSMSTMTQEKTKNEASTFPVSQSSVIPGNSTKLSAPSHVETHKFGQLELMESQKLLKRNVFASEPKTDTNKSEQHSSTPKKTLTSVQDLLKLQKERKEAPRPTTTENAPHLKNCKCNSCVVKKGWFKNKPLPKPDSPKHPHPEDSGDSSKPFESLTKAFTKISEGQSSKVSASVAPIVALPSSNALKTTTETTNSLPNKDATLKEKGIFQQRKLSFLERMKERERKEAAAAIRPSPNAFSPNNESSVYAFEPEPEQSGKTSTPFRSKTRDSRNSSSSTSKSDDDTLRICEDEPPTVSSGTQVENLALEPKTPSKVSQSASIAVQVNLDTETVAEVEPAPDVQDGKSIEISTQTEVPEEDSDSPMFYIPLQQARAAGAQVSSDQQLIQGVALKLGTEGPMGPNQRVIMKAKLVTKPPDVPSIKAVVMPQPKRIFDQKNNNPPIGTVQPTTRKPPEEEGITKPDASKPTENPPILENPSQSPGISNAEVENSSAKSTKNQSLGVVTGKTSKAKDKPQNTGKEKAETVDEHSPSSSASSSKSKRTSKQRNSESAINPSNNTWLPPAGSSKMVEAPTFHPTEKEFQDPFEYFDKIRPVAEKFGLCKIVPPNNFKPDCKVSDDMRFTAYNQYIHRMFHRWGPNIKEMMAIKKYLTTQSISLKQPPWIGGIEVDLPRLYQSVQNCGGLMKVMEKKKWHQVADMMKIPKAAQDRVTKLDDIYCKYLLPYDTLSHDERQKLFDEVEKDWTKRQQTVTESQGDEETEEENYIEECEECVVKGRNMALNQFYRIARNTMSMWFKSPEPPPREVENEFWKHVRERNHHVCVHSGSIDSSGWGYGFPVAKNNSFSKHPWNLKVLTNNPGSVLRSLGPVMGVTVPTLHVGMVFTTFCWYRDPHGLPWIEYLHTGAPKIWYGISDDNSKVFQEALTKLLPRYIKNKTIWLPSDTAMIPPDLLVENGVSLCHTVQEPGQFILVFPRAFTSSICTGYLVSESVYFAQPSWLSTAEQVFKDIQESCEPSMFSLEKLLFSIASDSRSSVEVLKQVLPMVWHVKQKELDGRKTLFNLGLKSSERLPPKEFGSKKKKGRWAQDDDGEYECEVCRTNLFVSLVTNSQEEGVYCLPHAIDLLTQKRHHLKFCKLLYSYTQEEMNELVEKLEQRIENKLQKKLTGKTVLVAK